MQEFLKKIFSPVLNIFEKNDGEFVYKPSHRKILIIVGILFLFLSGVSLFIMISFGSLGGILPTVVFFGTGAVCAIVGFLGSDHAVARIWKNR